MADVFRYSGAKVRHFSRTNQIPYTLIDPISISCYVYDPQNALVFSSSQPVRDPDYLIGVYDFVIPSPIFLNPTQPSAYFTITTFAQMPDGSIQTTEEVVQVA